MCFERSGFELRLLTGVVETNAIIRIVGTGKCARTNQVVGGLEDFAFRHGERSCRALGGNCRREARMSRNCRSAETNRLGGLWSGTSRSTGLEWRTWRTQRVHIPDEFPTESFLFAASVSRTRERERERRGGRRTHHRGAMKKAEALPLGSLPLRASIVLNQPSDVLAGFTLSRRLREDPQLRGPRRPP